MPDFPLMDPADVRRLRSLEAVAQGMKTLASEIQGGANDPAAPLYKALEQLREDMTRDRLRIGLIGPSQVGKSTTVANLLNVPESQSPTPVGGQQTACTSAITRVRPVPSTGNPEADRAGRKITLEFLRPDQFRNRVESICRLDGVELEADDYATIRQECVRRLGKSSTPSPELLHLLVRMIDSERAHRARLGGPPEVGSFDRRAEYLKHSDAVTPYALLRQVVIDYPTAVVEPRLELIDLPGLGTSGRADDLLTTQTLDQLDGAFIFHSAFKHLGDRSVGDLLDLLHRQFGDRLGRRIWVVTSGFDNVTKAGMVGNEQGQTVLHTLEKFLKVRGIDPDRALLTGNHLYQALLARATEDGTDQLAEVTEELVRWVEKEKSAELPLDIKLEWGADGRPVVPKNYLTCAALVPAYREVLKDGGIGRLRRVILHEVADVVQSEVRADVRSRLVSLRQRFRDQIDHAREGGDMRPDDLALAALWGASIGEGVIKPLRTQAEIYARPAGAIQEKLKGHLKRVVIQDLPMNVAGRLHQGYCGMLLNLALKEAGDQTMAIYSQVEKLFRAAAAGHAPLSSGEEIHRDPLAWWLKTVEPERTALQDLPMRAWYAPTFQGFNKPTLVFDGDDATFPHEGYLALMGRKIDALVYAYVTAVLDHIAGTIEPIRDTLQALGANPAHLNPVDPAVYQKLIEGLDTAPPAD